MRALYLLKSLQLYQQKIAGTNVRSAPTVTPDIEHINKNGMKSPALNNKTKEKHIIETSIATIRVNLSP